MLEEMPITIRIQYGDMDYEITGIAYEGGWSFNHLLADWDDGIMIRNEPTGHVQITADMKIREAQGIRRAVLPEPVSAE